MNYILKKTIQSKGSSTVLGIFKKITSEQKDKNNLFNEKYIIVKLYIKPEYINSLTSEQIDTDKLFGLEYESKVYDYLKKLNVFNDSINFIKGETLNPDVLRTILLNKKTSDEFLNVFELIEKEQKENDEYEELSSTQLIIFKDFKKNLLSTDYFSATVMEYKPKIFSLHELLVSGVFSKKEDELRIVLYQIVHALTILGKFKLQHNDLHTDNILILQHEEPQTFKYDHISIDTIYQVLIFDWDMAWSPYIGENKKLIYMCEEYGICGEGNFNKYFDLYTFICTIKSYIKSRELKKVITNYLGITKNITKYTIFDCRFQPELLSRIKNIRTPNEFINNKYFDKINNKDIEIPKYSLTKKFVNIFKK